MNYLKYLYSSPPTIAINLDKNNHTCFSYITDDNKLISYPTYFDNDKIAGNLELKLNNNKSTIIESLNIYLIGVLLSPNSKIKENIFEDFIQISEPNNPKNIINEITNFAFNFKPTKKPYETYRGNSFQIKYYLNAVATIKINDNVSKIENNVEICCLKPKPINTCNNELSNGDKSHNYNIGVENIIHINIKLLKNEFYLDNDAIIGKIKIVKSELQLNNIILSIKREEKFFIGNTKIENSQVMAKFELVEGYPEEGDEMKFRYYLNGVKNLTPSYNNTTEENVKKDKKFEVRYFLSFEFNEEKGYQFYKNIEISINRMNMKNSLMNKNKDDKKPNKGEDMNI